MLPSPAGEIINFQVCIAFSFSCLNSIELLYLMIFTNFLIASGNKTSLAATQALSIELVPGTNSLNTVQFSVEGPYMAKLQVLFRVLY